MFWQSVHLESVQACWPGYQKTQHCLSFCFMAGKCQLFACFLNVTVPFFFSYLKPIPIDFCWSACFSWTFGWITFCSFVTSAHFWLRRIRQTQHVQGKFSCTSHFILRPHCFELTSIGRLARWNLKLKTKPERTWTTWFKYMILWLYL